MCVDLKKAHADLEAMKKQAESSSREYDKDYKSVAITSTVGTGT